MTDHLIRAFRQQHKKGYVIFNAFQGLLPRCICVKHIKGKESGTLMMCLFHSATILTFKFLLRKCQQ